MSFFSDTVERQFDAMPFSGTVQIKFAVLSAREGKVPLELNPVAGAKLFTWTDAGFFAV